MSGGESWWQYQAKKFKPKADLPKIPAFKPSHGVEKTQPLERAVQPMEVEESTASDTAIHRILNYWKK